MKTNEGKKRFVVVKFLLIVLGAALVGFCLGFGAMWFREMLMGQAGALGRAGQLAARALPWVSWVVHLGLTLASLTLYLNCRAKFLAWDGEDEDLIEGVEHRLGVSMLLDNLMMILGFLFFTLLGGVIGLLEGWQFWLGLAGFLYCCLLYTSRRRRRSLTAWGCSGSWASTSARMPWGYSFFSRARQTVPAPFPLRSMAR